jgi:hypothetical protein
LKIKTQSSGKSALFDQYVVETEGAFEQLAAKLDGVLKYQKIYKEAHISAVEERNRADPEFQYYQ